MKVILIYLRLEFSLSLFRSVENSINWVSPPSLPGLIQLLFDSRALFNLVLFDERVFGAMESINPFQKVHLPKASKAAQNFSLSFQKPSLN